ncbi:MAG: hypothetical protein FJX71_00285 [Alphaproteobacteria bacterium]|nr:hypothetical protein [Alphaproteobacteria bacterium]
MNFSNIYILNFLRCLIISLTTGLAAVAAETPGTKVAATPPVLAKFKINPDSGHVVDIPPSTLIKNFERAVQDSIRDDSTLKEEKLQKLASINEMLSGLQPGSTEHKMLAIFHKKSLKEFEELDHKITRFRELPILLAKNLAAALASSQSPSSFPCSIPNYEIFKSTPFSELEQLDSFWHSMMPHPYKIIDHISISLHTDLLDLLQQKTQSLVYNLSDIQDVMHRVQKLLYMIGTQLPITKFSDLLTLKYAQQLAEEHQTTPVITLKNHLQVLQVEAQEIIKRMAPIYYLGVVCFEFQKHLNYIRRAQTLTDSISS